MCRRITALYHPQNSEVQKYVEINVYKNCL